MKTEQEQIEDIVKILLESSKKCLDADCNNCDKQYEKDCAQYRKALALVQAGYGDIKQAQIDVLNKTKKCSYCDNDFIDGKWHRYVFVDDIDKLIEEVQNGEDKS